MNRTTLGKVAKEAGVSKTTASLVLNGKADRVNLAASTIERVKTAAGKLNYRPAQFNPPRLNGKTGVLAVIASGFTDCKTGQWLQHIILQVKKKGYVVVPLTTHENPTDTFQDVMADGYIILDEKALNNLNETELSDLPVICAGFKPNNSAFESIHPDYRENVNTMISYLYRHNKKAIGLIAEDSGSFAAQKIIETYRENYCERFDIPENLHLLSATDNRSEAIAEAVKETTAKGANGIIFETPEIAIEALSQKNVRNLTTQKLMFACCGERPEFKMLDNDILLVCPENIEEMASKVVGKLL
jgi:DNA-binding LacI/PurR family transcriptional regulator